MQVVTAFDCHLITMCNYFITPRVKQIHAHLDVCQWDRICFLYSVCKPVSKILFKACRYSKVRITTLDINIDFRILVGANFCNDCLLLKNGRTVYNIPYTAWFISVHTCIILAGVTLRNRGIHSLPSFEGWQPFRHTQISLLPWSTYAQ